MKKRLLVISLCMALIMVLVPTAMMAENAIEQAVKEVNRTGPYKNDSTNTINLPEEPTKSADGTIWTVNPANAQYTLDGAYGDINGKTIHFGTGDYTDVLVLARPTKFTDSKTVYYNMTWGSDTWTKNDTSSDYSQLSSNIRTYERTVSGVTFTSGPGVVLPGFKATSGHIYSSSGNSEYDYVIDAVINGTNNSYYGASSLNNITFQGLTISGGVHIDNYVQKTEASNSNITFQNCNFTGNETEMATNGFTGIGMKADSEQFTNITIQNCTFTNYFQGIYIQGPDTLAIKNCEIDNTTHNAIAIQSSTSKTVKGDITIQENVIQNAKDRAIRFGNIGDSTSVAINNNIILESGDTAEELIKAGSVGDDVDIDLENNYWDGKDLSTAIATSEDGNGFASSVIPQNVGIISGTFPDDINIDEYMAEGYAIMDNGDGTFTVIPAVSSRPSTPSNKPSTPVDPCTERIGTGWVYDEGVGHCVYKGSGQTIPNTSTK